MPTSDKQLPTLGFDVSELFCASRETVHARLNDVSSYTSGSDEFTVEEAYYLGHVGVHLTYQDHVVAEVMVRGRHAGQDICARDLRVWARFGDVSQLQGPSSSTWQLVDVDDHEVFAHSSQLPLWRPDFAKLLATQEEAFANLLGESFARHSWLGYADRTSRVDMHARFSRVDGRLNRLAVNLPLGIDVLSRKEEVLEWAGIADTREAIVVSGGLKYNVTLLCHGIQLRAFKTPWSCPLPDADSIHTGRSRAKKVTLPEAVALAEAKLKRRFSRTVGLDIVVDPERIEETEDSYIFQSISIDERELQDWLPQTYDPSVGLEDLGSPSRTTPLPAVHVRKATGVCKWSSGVDGLKNRFQALCDRIASVFGHEDS